MIAIFYTALVLGYTLDGQMLTATFWVKSYDQCLQAMDELEHMYDFIADQVATDNRIFMWCKESPVPSKKQVKPMPKPNA